MNLRQFAFDVQKAIMTLGNCKIVSYQAFAKRRNISIKEVIEECESDEGCTHKRGKNYIIMFNDAQDIESERKLFTLAHELGHILLGHVVLWEEYKTSHGKYPDKRLEWDADYFAACAFAPIPLLCLMNPKSTLPIRRIFGLSRQAAGIVFDDYKSYDRDYHIEWHDDIINLFDFQSGLLQIATYQIDSNFDSWEYVEPRISVPKIWEDIKSTAIPMKTIDTEEIMLPELFEELEDGWLYPESLALS